MTQSQKEVGLSKRLKKQSQNSLDRLKFLRY